MSRTLDYKSFSELWPQAKTHLLDPPKGVDLPWWPNFSHFIGGLRPHEVTLLCAPTGAGKTQLLANISAQLVEQAIPHFVAPVETGPVDYAIRVVSAMDNCDYNTGYPISPDKLDLFYDKFSRQMFHSGMQVAMYEDRVKVEDMRNTLVYMNQAYGCKVALLDNLNFFLDIVGKQYELAEMDAAIHELVILGKQIPMHILLIVHPKKTDNGRVVSEFDIKGSSTAVQEASNVILFNRPDEKQHSNQNWSDREVVFKKIRKRGAFVNQPIWMYYRHAKFGEIAK